MNTTNTDVAINPGTQAISDTTRHTTVAGLLFLYDTTTTIFGRRYATGLFAAVPGASFQATDLDELRGLAVDWIAKQIAMVDARFMLPSPPCRVCLRSFLDDGRQLFVLSYDFGHIATSRDIVALLTFAALRGYVVFSNE